MTVAATPKNYDGQRTKLREVMRRHGLQVVVLSSYQAVSYCAGTNILTQVTLPDRLAFLACFADGEDVLVVCSIEATMVRGQTDIADIVEYTEFTDDPTAVLIGVLKDRGLTRDGRHRGTAAAGALLPPAADRAAFLVPGDRR